MYVCICRYINAIVASDWVVCCKWVAETGFLTNAKFRIANTITRQFIPRIYACQDRGN